MTTLDSTALWSATALAFDEQKLGTAGLSVRQRKLLALLSQPASVQQLAQTIALPIEEVHSVLERFAKLGLAQSNVEAPVSPMQARVTAHTAAAAVDGPSRTPMYIGIAVAALAVVAAAAWFLRSGSSSSPAPQAASTAAPKASSGPATGPADTADTVTPRTAANPAGSSPAAAAPPPAPAANTKSAAATAPATTAPAATAPAAASKAAATPTTTAPAAATKAAATPAAAAPATATPATATAAPATTTAAPTTTAPATTAAPVTAPPPAATVAAAPPPAAAPAPAPAAARPAPAAAREIKLVSRVDPGFPRGVDADKGAVKARLQVDARGAVTGVDIIESNPPRVFDRAVRNALQQWRYEPTGEAFTVQAEINFSR